MSHGLQYNRQPCPGRVFEDLGNGFAIGCLGGSLFYFLKGKFPKPPNLIWRDVQRPETSAHLQWALPCPEQSTLSWWELRPLGRHLLDHRVLVNTLQTERRPVQRDNRRLCHRRCTFDPRRCFDSLQASNDWWRDSSDHRGSSEHLHGNVDKEPAPHDAVDAKGSDRAIENDDEQRRRKPLGGRV